MLIDTHTHMYLDDFSDDKDCAVSRAIAAGVEMMMFPNVDQSTIIPMQELHNRFPRNTIMAMGLHPTEIKDGWREDLEFIGNELHTSASQYHAVGEIGIDLYWDKTFKIEQMEALTVQLKWACQLNLPVIIHCREGLDEILEVFSKIDRLPTGVFHSFGGTIEDVERIRTYGDFYFGINGIVTFKNSKLRDVLPTIGVDRILLETDAPYLAPVPHRGKRNESAFILHTATHIAQHLNISIEDLTTITSHSAASLFGIPSISE